MTKSAKTLGAKLGNVANQNFKLTALCDELHVLDLCETHLFLRSNNIQVIERLWATGRRAWITILNSSLLSEIRHNSKNPLRLEHFIFIV